MLTPSTQALRHALAGHDFELSQVVAVLAAAGIADPEHLPLGQGDRALLDVVRAVTGSDLELVVTCSGCGVTNSAVLSAHAVGGGDLADSEAGGEGVREPTYADLVGLPAGAEWAAAELLRRCTVGSPAEPPSPDDLARVDTSLSGPLVFACTGCGGEVGAAVDVERFALERLVQWADGVDYEVHLLAHAYHWDLDTIERMADERRRRFARLIVTER